MRIEEVGGTTGFATFRCLGNMYSVLSLGLYNWTMWDSLWTHLLWYTFLPFCHMAAFLTQKTFFQRHKLEPYPRTDFTFQLLHFRITNYSYNRRNLRNELLDAGRTVPFYRGKTKQSLESKNLIQMSDLAQSAEWVFGPGGLPNLKVFAFGDFTMDSRSNWAQLLPYRRDPEDAEDFSANTEDESSGDEKRRKTKNRKVDQKSSEDDTRQRNKKRKFDEEVSDDDKRQKTKKRKMEGSSGDSSSRDDTSSEDSSSQDGTSSDDTTLNRAGLRSVGVGNAEKTAPLAMMVILFNINQKIKQA